ncbi:hypothetical protein MN608_02799 [Microdochium nivale]|nr:hypothetical protein MN608_02799 [Microdochium nivale]
MFVQQGDANDDADGDEDESGRVGNGEGSDAGLFDRALDYDDDDDDDDDDEEDDMRL